jgi:hypothetical protein
MASAFHAEMYYLDRRFANPPFHPQILRLYGGRTLLDGRCDRQCRSPYGNLAPLSEFGPSLCHFQPSSWSVPYGICDIRCSSKALIVGEFNKGERYSHQYTAHDRGGEEVTSGGRGDAGLELSAVEGEGPHEEAEGERKSIPCLGGGRRRCERGKWGQHAAPAPRGIQRGGMCPCAYAPWLMRAEMHIKVGEDESRWQSHHSHAPDG